MSRNKLARCPKCFCFSILELPDRYRCIRARSCGAEFVLGNLPECKPMPEVRPRKQLDKRIKPGCAVTYTYTDYRKGTNNLNYQVEVTVSGTLVKLGGRSCHIEVNAKGMKETRIVPNERVSFKESTARSAAEQAYA